MTFGHNDMKKGHAQNMQISIMLLHNAFNSQLKLELVTCTTRAAKSAETWLNGIVSDQIK